MSGGRVLSGRTAVGWDRGRGDNGGTGVERKGCCVSRGDPVPDSRKRRGKPKLTVYAEPKDSAKGLPNTAYIFRRRFYGHGGLTVEEKKRGNFV